MNEHVVVCDYGIKGRNAVRALLGMAAGAPATVEVVEDLLSFGQGLDLVTRTVSRQEIGSRLADLGLPVLAVVRDGHRLMFSEPEAQRLVAGDQILYVET